MHKPSVTLVFMAAMLLHPLAGGAQPLNGDFRDPSRQAVRDYDARIRTPAPIETIGATANMEPVRNEQTVYFERPEPGGPGRLCALDPDAQRLSRAESR